MLRPAEPISNIQIHDFEGVVLDELAARFDVFSHERRENIFSRDGILKFHLEERAGVRVHRGLPELRRIHFAKTLEPRDGEIFLRDLHHVAQHVLRFFLGGFVAVARDEEGRLVEFLDLFGQRAQALVFGRGCQCPVDFLVVRRAKLDFVQTVLFVESDFAFELQFDLFDFFQQLFEGFFLLELGFLVQTALGEQFGEASVAQAPPELRRHGLVLLHVQQERSQSRALQRDAFLALHDVVFGGALHQLAREVALVANVFLALPALHAVERRLRDVNVIALDELLHVPEEKSQQQRANVRTVDVRIGHENNLVIAQFSGVEIVLADAGPERGDDGANFFVPQHFVVARLFDVEDFSLERQDGLVLAVASLLRRPAGRFTLNDEQLAPRRIALLAIGEFSRQAARIHRGFAARQFARLAGRFARARRFDALADDAPRDGGVLVEPLAEFFVHELFDVALDVAVQFALGLPFKLRLRQAHAHHGNQAFADVVTGDGDFVLLFSEHSRGRSEVVDRARKRGAKTGEMRAAIDGVDGIGEGKNVFTVSVVVLERDFDFDVAALALHVDRRIMQRGFAAIQMFYEFRDPAREPEFRGLFRALIGKRNLQALIQKSQLAQALRERIEAVDGLIKNAGVWVKSDFRAGLACLAGLLQLGGRLAFLVGLFPHLAIALNFQLQPVGKRVDHGNAHAVQAAGNFVGLAVEFSARMQQRHYHFHRGALFRLVHVHGNAAAVVHHSDGLVGVHGDVDLIGVAGQRFVYGVVHHFPDEMVQAHLSRRADVHCGAQAHGFESAENFDGFRVVLVAALRRAAYVFFVTHVFSPRSNFFREPAG